MSLKTFFKVGRDGAHPSTETKKAMHPLKKAARIAGAIYRINGTSPGLSASFMFRAN